MEATSSKQSLQCVVVTPERAVLDEAVDFVAMPMYDGELGVLPGRAPLIGRLGFGELRTIKAGHTNRYYIDGGFAQIRDNVVTILTSKAVKAEEINAQAAEQALASTQAVAAPQEQEERLKNQERARAQLRVARKGSEQGSHH